MVVSRVPFCVFGANLAAWKAGWDTVRLKSWARGAWLGPFSFSFVDLPQQELDRNCVGSARGVVGGRLGNRRLSLVRFFSSTWEATRRIVVQIGEVRCRGHGKWRPLSVVVPLVSILGLGVRASTRATSLPTEAMEGKRRNDRCPRQSGYAAMLRQSDKCEWIETAASVAWCREEDWRVPRMSGC